MAKVYAAVRLQPGASASQCFGHSTFGYEGCEVDVLSSTPNHPVKIPKILCNED